MNVIQIVLVVILGILSLVFVGLLSLRFRGRNLSFRHPRRKQIQKVMDILCGLDDDRDQWNELKIYFHSEKGVDYRKINALLHYAINANNSSTQNTIEKARRLILLHQDCLVFGDNQITDIIEKFRAILSHQNNDKLKEVGYDLIRQISRHYNALEVEKKYDEIINWIFRAIEIVGFVLAIISVGGSK